MTFLEYIRERRITDTPAGDFTTAAKADRRMPDVKSWPELRRYLERNGAIRDAVKAGHTVWQAYQAAQKREGAPDVNQRAKSIVDQVTRGD